MRPFIALCVCIVATVPALAQGPSRWRVLTDFPGGSAKVEANDSNAGRLSIVPHGDGKRGWTCWWYFKVEGLKPGESIVLDVGGQNFALADRAVVSTDRKTWTQTEPGKREKSRIVYNQKALGTEMWFAWGQPFLLADAQALVDRAGKRSPHARPFELCKSKKGRSVPALQIQQGDAKDRIGIWIHARQHAWESGSSWVCQGLVEWLISDDPLAEELRKKAVIFIVPIMDVDNVEDGFGGKNQFPHDHNRDWSAEPIYSEVQAAMGRMKEMTKTGRLDLFIDLHNPGPGDRTPFFFVPPREELSVMQRGNLDAFLDSARKEITGPLKLDPKPRESGKSYDPNWKKISGNWVVMNTLPHTVGLCLETAWNTPASVPVNYERVGRELGMAVARYVPVHQRTK